MIKFFADTADLKEIAYCFSHDVGDGITTNPSILEATGNMSQGFEAACKGIVETYPKVPVSLETDIRGLDVRKLQEISPEKVRDILLEQAYNLVGIGDNVVIKIPVCEGGLLAAEELTRKGIKTNITACMTPYQALEAAKLGNGYVSLFAGRMRNYKIFTAMGNPLEALLTTPDWKQVVAEGEKNSILSEQAWRETLEEIAYVARELDQNSNVDLIVGSIRTPKDVCLLSSAKPQVITIPTKIVRGLAEKGYNLKDLKAGYRTVNTGEAKSRLGDSIYHPMTTITLEQFEKSADSYRK